MRNAADSVFLYSFVECVISRDIWNCLLLNVASVLLPRPLQWDQLKNKSQKISTRSLSLDNVLKGGFRRSTLSEICGIASAGKTTLLLQTALSVLLHGGSVLYFSTESFQPDRLTQLLNSCTVPEKWSESVYDRLIVSQQSDWRSIKTQLSQMQQLADELLRTGTPLSLIVIDSIAAIDFAEIYGAQLKEPDYNSILSFLGELAVTLKSFAILNNVAVIFSNQVRSMDGYTVPAFGLSWSNHISTRLIITRTPCADKRLVRVAYSTSPCDSSSVELTLCNDGFNP